MTGQAQGAAESLSQTLGSLKTTQTPEEMEGAGPAHTLNQGSAQEKE